MQIMIVGAGKLGYKLAESLSQEENNVIMVDYEEKALEKANYNLDILTVKANGAQISVLEQLNIKNMDLVLAVTSSDETNMLIASLSKKLGCTRVVARIRNPEYADQTAFVKQNLEIDYVANPDLETAKEITKYLLKGQALHMEDFAKGKVTMADFRLKNRPDMVDKKIMDLEIPKGLLIVAVLRDGSIMIPHGHTVLAATDLIYVIGKKESINEFCVEEGNKRDNKSVKKTMILGGGKAGYYLAKKLLCAGVMVKIIEMDKERCKYLAEELPNALVIHGDGTDPHLLVEENITEAEALVSLTGYDEENLLLALMAKKYGVRKVIAKVSRPNYIPLIEQLGIDIAVNPVLITAAEILRFIQGGRVVSLSLLLGGEAEALEIIAQPDSLVIEKTLMEINLPKGIIIGAVVHKGKVIIPDGKTVIHAGDRLIVFCLQDEAVLLDKYFYRSKGGVLNELWNHYKGSRKSTHL